MKKCRLFIMMCLLITMLCACGSGEKNCDIEKNDAGQIIKKTYHDDSGNITKEHTFTYYESGATHTEKIVYVQIVSSDTAVEEIEYSENGLRMQRKTYDANGRITYDLTMEYYASKEENWHIELDAQDWRYQRGITYAADGSFACVEWEYMDDHTYVERFYSEDGILGTESVFKWNAENENWLDYVKSVSYDVQGRPLETIEYDVEGYDRKITCHFPDGDGTEYIEWFDEDTNLKKYGTYAENGTFFIHTISQGSLTMRTSHLKNAEGAYDLYIQEYDANRQVVLEALYSTATGERIN